MAEDNKKVGPVEPEPRRPLLGLGVNRLVNSSKALVMIVAIGAMCALAYFGKITGDQALDFCKWVVLAFLGAVAVEDGAAKLTRRRASRLNKDGFDQLVSAFMPLIMSLLKPEPPGKIDAEFEEGIPVPDEGVYDIGSDGRMRPSKPKGDPADEAPEHKDNKE